MLGRDDQRAAVTSKAIVLTFLAATALAFGTRLGLDPTPLPAFG